MKIVGLTGGIGSGKTTVAEIFASLGIPVFYADQEAKALYAEPKVLEKVKEIVNADEVVTADGKINKAKLAEIIFNDSKKRDAINQFIHPLVRKRFDEWVSKQNSPYCIREAAILIESGSYKDCDKIIVVTSSTDKRIERVMSRDGASEQEIKKRIDAQLTDEQRMQYADFIIENISTTSFLNEQIRSIHQQLIA